MAKRSRELEDISSVPNDEEDVAIVQVSKILGLDVDDSEAGHTTQLQQCSLPGHRPGLTFTSYEDYEMHCNKVHANRCLECNKNFPSSHILNLHLEECHNVFAALKKERGEHIYACFIESCNEKCSTPNKRRMHLIKEHHYPDNYFFAVTKAGIDGRQSMLVEHGHSKSHSNQWSHARKPDKGSTGSDTSVVEKEIARTEVPNNGPKLKPNKQENENSMKEMVDTEMEVLAGAISSLAFVPTSVRFGPRQKAGFGRR